MSDAWTVIMVFAAGPHQVRCADPRRRRRIRDDRRVHVIRGSGSPRRCLFRRGGTGEQHAAWTFTVTPGVYRISATWSEHPNRATNAPFHIYDGDTFLGEVRMNQELAPDDFRDGGTWWEDLGDGVYRITGTTLSVYLLDAADDYVIADAVRIERLG